MMKCWLEDWLDFLFPEPVEQDMDGEVDIPIEPVSDTYDWDAGFTLKIPGFYRTEPAVKEAERVVRSRR